MDNIENMDGLNPSEKENTTRKVKKGLPQEIQDKIDNILLDAEKTKGETLVLHPTGEIEVKNILDKILHDARAIDDPNAKFDLYYKMIERLLKKNLPTGKENARFRGLVREEKCVYLTRGKRKDEKGLRHADSRQTYIEDAKTIYEILLKWVGRGGNMIDLHNTLVNENVAKGYGKRQIF